jgi:hypothetical protein
MKNARSAMLARCQLEAERARIKAETAHSPEHKRDFQFMEMRWLMLARQYDTKGPRGNLAFAPHAASYSINQVADNAWTAEA